MNALLVYLVMNVLVKMLSLIVSNYIYQRTIIINYMCQLLKLLVLISYFLNFHTSQLIVKVNKKINENFFH